MCDFEELLCEHRAAVERLVKFRLPDNGDAEDVLQEILWTASRRFDSLRDPARFKPWLLQIARNRCCDYFRERGRSSGLPEPAPTGRTNAVAEAVRETLTRLSPKEREVLVLSYYHELPQAEIAAQLGIPVGTVKSRLHAAKRSFREEYPCPPTKGAISMKKLPKILPEYTLEWSDQPPFPVRWEELMGWFIVPRIGEKLRWAMYDFPERVMTESVALEVMGRAMVHGIEGVEIRAVETNPMDCNAAGGQSKVERHFVAQLTGSHCRCLAESHMEDGVKQCFTFLDGPAFLDNWGFGEDNCGNEIRIVPKGDIVREGSAVRTRNKEFLLDVVGRCTVTINGRTWDTICVMDVDAYNANAISEQFIDENGRTVLWRRFNPDDWRAERYGGLWSERFPDNERITVNGTTCVHWYDCITDYVL